MPYHFFTRQASVNITPEEDGSPLLDFLARRFPYHSPDLWAELIAEGRVSSNGHVVGPDRVLHGGDQLHYQPRPICEPAIDEQVGVLHDSPDLLVVNKPGNLPCHPAGCFFNHTLWAMLKTSERQLLTQPLAQLAALDEPHFINRLDRETSGVVLIAKNSRAAKKYAKALQRQQGRKFYLVIVEGRFPSRLCADGWLSNDSNSPVRKKRRFSVSKPPDEVPAENARTDFRCLLSGGGLSLLRAELHTGRTHQIRATLASLGFPVVGDKLYGVDDGIYLRFIADQLSDNDRQRLRLPRQALHAWKIFINGPLGHQHFRAPLPDDLRQLISNCRMARPPSGSPREI